MSRFFFNGGTWKSYACPGRRSYNTIRKVKKVRTLSVKGSRGQITDNSGIPLAYDQSYDISSWDPSKIQRQTNLTIRTSSAQTIEIIEQNSGDD